MNSLIFFIFVSSAANAISLEMIYDNNKAVDFITSGELNRAETTLLGSLVKDPYNPVLHINLGRIYELQKAYDKALKEYELVLRTEPLSDEIKFVAEFNAGNAAAQAKQVDVALQHYQKALKVDPNSHDVKNNIEVLMLQNGGGGKGEGENEDPNGDKDGEGQGKLPYENPKQGPTEFDSKNLTKEDVKKIFEEIKSQEKKIRKMDNQGKAKEESPEKDW